MGRFSSQSNNVWQHFATGVVHLCKGNEIFVAVGDMTVKITCDEIGNADGNFLGLIVDLPQKIECKLWEEEGGEPEESSTDYITIPLISQKQIPTVSSESRERTAIICDVEGYSTLDAAEEAQSGYELSNNVDGIKVVHADGRFYVVYGSDYFGGHPGPYV
jgi:hypothetical protein